MKDAFRVWMEKYNIDLGEEFMFGSDAFKIELDQKGEPILYISTCYGYEIATLVTAGFSTITNALYKICMLESPEFPWLICPICGNTLTIKHSHDDGYGAYCKECSFSSTFQGEKFQDIKEKIEEMKDKCMNFSRRDMYRYFGR